MRVTDKLEKIMESLMDRIGCAFSGGKIHPIEIAKKAIQELKKNQKVSVSQTYVPNIYQIILNPEDMNEIILYEEAIIPEIKEYLMTYIKKEELSILGELQIEFHKEETMEHGKFEVKSVVKKGKIPEAEMEKTLVRENPYVSSVWVNVKEGPEKRQTFKLIKGLNIIGRKEEHQVRISGSDISRSHAAINLSVNEAYIEDMGSTNGTYLNGENITEKKKLKDGDFISLGDTLLEFKSEK